MAKVLRVPTEGLSQGELVLSEAASRYVTRVHRRRVGAELILFDPGAGLEARAVLTSDGAPAVCLVSAPAVGTRPGYGELCLFQGLGKGQKLEDVIRETTALGVGAIQPVECLRSIVRTPSKHDRVEAKLSRWRQVAIDAARQCERSDVPGLAPALAFDTALKRVGSGAHFILSPHVAAPPLQAALAQGAQLAGSVGLWIGPEGGFAAEEVAALRAAGAVEVSLGPWVLRTETAATAAVTLAVAVLSSARG